MYRKPFRHFVSKAAFYVGTSSTTGIGTNFGYFILSTSYELTFLSTKDSLPTQTSFSPPQSVLKGKKTRNKQWQNNKTLCSEILELPVIQHV
ncbi:hypothetical protein X975_03324, partial [Stegodyphus mimosarum]